MYLVSVQNYPHPLSKVKMSDESEGKDEELENHCKVAYPLKTCFVSLEKLKVNEDQSGVVKTFLVGKRKLSVISDGEEIKRKRQRTDKKYDSNLVKIWSKFFSFSRKFRWTDPFSPYEATNEQVASFVHYLKVTERVDMEYLEDIALWLPWTNITQEERTTCSRLLTS